MKYNDRGSQKTPNEPDNYLAAGTSGNVLYKNNILRKRIVLVFCAIFYVFYIVKRNLKFVRILKLGLLINSLGLNKTLCESNNGTVMKNMT